MSPLDQDALVPPDVRLRAVRRALANLAAQHAVAGIASAPTQFPAGAWKVCAVTLGGLRCLTVCHTPEAADVATAALAAEHGLPAILAGGV